MTEVHDFDAWMAYAQDEQPATRTVRLLGREWQVPADPPALIVLKLARLRELLLTPKDPDAQIPDDLIELTDPVTALAALVGRERVQEWLEDGLTLSGPRRLLWAAYGMYQGAAATPPDETSGTTDPAASEDDEAGKAPSTDSSTASAPSRPAGGRSTGKS